MNKIKKILVLGLPRSGKTTLARELSKQLQAVWWDADIVRGNINADLGFSIQDRIEQSKRMAFLADTVSEAGHFSVCSFVCPTRETQSFFDPSDTFVIYMNTIKPEDSPWPDTVRLFQPPKFYDMVFTSWEDPKKMAEDVIKELNYVKIEDRKLYQI